MFQSTPRFVGEGNLGRASGPRGRRGFNPPPALSARGTRRPGAAAVTRDVSIHPPLCRRGEPGCFLCWDCWHKFQSTPRFVGEGNDRIPCRQ